MELFCACKKRFSPRLATLQGLAIQYLYDLTTELCRKQAGHAKPQKLKYSNIGT